MPLKLEIDIFDPASLKRAAAQVRAYEKRFQEKQQLFLRRLVDECIKVIQEKYAIPQPYDGKQLPVDVTATYEDNAATITASGETLFFLEFGTGISHREPSYGPFEHGTYGKLKGGQTIWGFYLDGDESQLRLTSGNDPIEAFPAAEQRIQEVYADIAREVFGSD